MRILILTRSFSPDSGVASVRMHMFAKYLSRYGHDITVIRSGRIIYNNPSRGNMEGLEKVRIFSYEGENSDAEQYERGEWRPEIPVQVGNKSSSMLKKVSAYLRAVIGTVARPIKTLYRFYWQEGFLVSRQIQHCARIHLQKEKYDVIISTFSPLGTIIAANSLKKEFGSKWIIDFRDIMNRTLYSVPVRRLLSHTQKKYARRADACLCVSEGNRQIFEESVGREVKIHVIPNGYEESTAVYQTVMAHGNLTFCYTGSWYKTKQDLTLLYSILHEAGIKQYHILYAGNQYGEFYQNASASDAQDHLVNLGYLTREEIERVQANADIFLVASWNSEKEQGVMTGKFFEALRCKKPVIAIVAGDRGHSELRSVIEKYHIGICCEAGDRSGTYLKSVAYLKAQAQRIAMIREGENGNNLLYEPDEKIYELYRYDNIVKRLEQLIRCM